MEGPILSGKWQDQEARADMTIRRVKTRRVLDVLPNTWLIRRQLS